MIVSIIVRDLMYLKISFIIRQVHDDLSCLIMKSYTSRQIIVSPNTLKKKQRKKEFRDRSTMSDEPCMVINYWNQSMSSTIDHAA